MTARTAKVIGDMIVVHACKSDLVLDVGELYQLVTRDRAAWVRAIRRGKALRRALQAEQRSKSGTQLAHSATELMLSQDVAKPSLSDRQRGQGDTA